jgi:hypothetical protein
MNETRSALVECWGEENARAACRLQIYITDKYEAANEQFRREIESTAVYQSGAIHFGRPDLEKIIENHSLNLIATRSCSRSVQPTNQGARPIFVIECFLDVSNRTECLARAFDDIQSFLFCHL